MDIAEIRRDRLREYAASIGGPAKLADKIGKSDSQVSQMIGRKPTRNIGRGLARAIEKKLGLSEYWLDGTTDNADRPAPEAMIGELARELTPEQQADLIRNLRTLVEINRTRAARQPGKAPAPRRQLAKTGS